MAASKWSGSKSPSSTEASNMRRFVFCFVPFFFFLRPSPSSTSSPPSWSSKPPSSSPWSSSPLSSANPAKRAISSSLAWSATFFRFFSLRSSSSLALLSPSLRSLRCALSTFLRSSFLLKVPGASRRLYDRTSLCPKRTSSDINGAAPPSSSSPPSSLFSPSPSGPSAPLPNPKSLPASLLLWLLCLAASASSKRKLNLLSNASMRSTSSRSSSSSTSNPFP
mmetsp:Transcript_58563/g.110466  ORF Transcript_58563/g.110466 Transcript_58563/m.110466 type:complete len:222 (-) Transcript_58563:303-968(-)